jgi:hypothetical protein
MTVAARDACDEAIQPAHNCATELFCTMDCFVEPVIGAHSRDHWLAMTANWSDTTAGNKTKKTTGANSQWKMASSRG